MKVSERSVGVGSPSWNDVNTHKNVPHLKKLAELRAFKQI